VHFHLPCWPRFTSSFPLLEQVHLLTLLTEIIVSSHYHCWNFPFWKRHTFSRFFLGQIHTFTFLGGTGSHFTLLSRSGTHLHFLTRTDIHSHFSCWYICTLSLSLPENVNILAFLAGTSAPFVISCWNKYTFSLSLLERVHPFPCPGAIGLCFPLTCLDPVPFTPSWVLNGHFHTLAWLTWYLKMEVTHSSEMCIYMTSYPRKLYLNLNWYENLKSLSVNKVQSMINIFVIVKIKSLFCFQKFRRPLHSKPFWTHLMIFIHYLYEMHETNKSIYFTSKFIQQNSITHGIGSTLKAVKQISFWSILVQYNPCSNWISSNLSKMDHVYNIFTGPKI
jgi:hypothetical protein